jgi:hypothetical protein
MARVKGQMARVKGQIIYQYRDQMMCEYAAKLAQNMPAISPPKHIDVVLDGGLFNGSYLIGVCYFLKHIPVARISGCSIGSLVGLLFWADGLDLLAAGYDELMSQFRQTKTFYAYTDLVRNIALPDDILQRVNGRLFVTYYSATSLGGFKKAVKRRFKTVHELRECIVRSSFIPWMSAPEALYQGRYIDGLIPFVFNPSKRRILFVDLHSTWRKCSESVVAKNEHTNAHRVLSGLVDAHAFFVKGYDTELCSYVDAWSVRRRVDHWIRAWIAVVLSCVAFNGPTNIDTSSILYRVLREFIHAVIERYIC